jgi:uncharacterized protein (TIGR02757 family)
MVNKTVREILEKAYIKHSQPNFIADDPISIPHTFSLKQDIEISAFWIAMLAWGNRKAIINSGKKLMELMDNSPHDFVLNHAEMDLKRFSDFRHRTFNYTDTLYFIEFFKHHYSTHSSLEEAFSRHMQKKDHSVENALIGFHDYFFSLEYAPTRTRKHIATPVRNSSCKRLNMFLRWMVREDKNGVDFGLWTKIKPSQLLCPLDVHVEKNARKLGLISRSQTNWKTVLELTENLRKFDSQDPVKYDYALFGLGIDATKKGLKAP